MQPDPDPTKPDVLPGALWLYAGRAGRSAAKLRPEDLRRALAEDDWVWVHLDLLDQRVHRWVGEVCGLAPDAAAVFAGGDGGASFQARDGMMWGMCPDFGTDAARPSNRVGRFAFWATERLLVTGRRQPLESLWRGHAALAAGAEHATAFGLLAAIVVDFCHTAALQLRGAEAELDAVEDRLLASETSDERVALKAVRRLALALHRPVATMVAELREVTEDAEDDGRSTATLAIMVARLESLDQMVLHANDRAKLLQEELAAQLADDSNRSLRALTVMTALLMPGTLVVGIFGMNTSGLPLDEVPWGTTGALLLAGAATMLFYRILKRAGASLKF